MFSHLAEAYYWIATVDWERPLAHDTVGGIVERAGELAALPMPVHAHMLRHGTGYYLANRGIDTRTIQSYLGHNNRSLSYFTTLIFNLDTALVTLVI